MPAADALSPRAISCREKVRLSNMCTVCTKIQSNLRDSATLSCNLIIIIIIIIMIIIIIIIIIIITIDYSYVALLNPVPW